MWPPWHLNLSLKYKSYTRRFVGIYPILFMSSASGFKIYSYRGWNLLANQGSCIFLFHKAGLYEMLNSRLREESL